MAAGPMQGAPMPGASPAMPGAHPPRPPMRPGAPAGGPPGGPPGPGPQPVPPPPPKPPVTIDAVMQLLRDDRMRGFRIDIETDQLVEADEQAEKQRRMEFVTAIGGLLGNAMQLEANPAAGALLPAVGASIMFAVRGFRAGRELEETIETALERAALLISQPKPQEQDPKAAVQMQVEQVKLQGVREKAAAESQKAQMEIVGKQVEQQDDFARLDMDRQRMMAEQAREDRASQMEERMAMLEAQLREREHQLEMMRMERQAAVDHHAAMMPPAMGGA